MKSDLYPTEIDPIVQEGLDNSYRELYNQQAAAIINHSNGLNPKTAPVHLYLSDNKLIAKATDKNLGIAVFTISEYQKALYDLIEAGPYEYLMEADMDFFPNAYALHEKLKSKLPKGLTKEELKFINKPRQVGWPQFHIIPKVHKQPWGWRPIVPAHSSATARLSKVIDIALSPLLERFPWLINSTAGFINHFNKVLPKGDGRV